MLETELSDGLEIAERAREALQSKKAEDVVLLDVRKLSSITDYFLIATGTSAPHVKALFQEVQASLKAGGADCFRKSGTPESGWLVADYVDAVIHIFMPEHRSYYALEDLWNDAKVVD